LKGSVRSSEAWVANGSIVEMPIVSPSGRALATAATPTLPAAPARFSITTGWPSSAPSRSAMTRESTSVDPPGEETGR
jgi:hypothetical protein